MLRAPTRTPRWSSRPAPPAPRSKRTTARPAVATSSWACVAWPTPARGPVRSRPAPGGSGRLGGQRSDERLLRHLDPADHLHPLLAFLLLLQQLALPGDVAAVALGQHVLAHRPNGLAGNHSRSDSCLDRHLELLPGD